jgi:hypothetical protein
MAGYPGQWQRDFWERRVRADEATEDYARYVLLNPYRAGLVRVGESWPWTWLPDPARWEFATALGPHGEPPAEWIAWPEERWTALATGE